MQENKTYTKRGTITLFIGPSGAGKDYLMKKFLKENKNVKPIVSYTTRPKREGEVNGIDYNFVSHDEFQWMIEKKKVFEYRAYETTVGGKKDTWFYGTPCLDTSLDYAGVVDIQGAESFIKEYGGNMNLNVSYVYVNEDIRKERAEKRGSFDISEWNRRLKDDRKVFSEHNLNALEQKLKNIKGNKGHFSTIINQSEEENKRCQILDNFKTNNRHTSGGAKHAIGTL